MARLDATLIDVGWGDSIFIESVDAQGKSSFALVDSNDTTYNRSSYIFLRKLIERRGMSIKNMDHFFEFIMLTHAHGDHAQGLKAIMREFGARRFYYSRAKDGNALDMLQNYCNRSKKIEHHQAVDSNTSMERLGEADLDILWPEYRVVDDNENNNSIVMTLALGNVSMVLSGDAEGEVWDIIAGQIPKNTLMFKVPHHGSVNGFFGPGKSPSPWLQQFKGSGTVKLAISSHIRPFKHPHKEVLDAISKSGLNCFRTDEHYHITFSTDGSALEVKYSHV